MKRQVLTIAIILSGLAGFAQDPEQSGPASLPQGVVITSLSAADDEAYDMLLQKDGKIILTGYSNTDIAAVRYLPNGTLDPSFGSGGIVKTALRTVNAITSAIALQSDGKVILAGSANNGQTNDFAILRYNSNGSLDQTFGKQGIVITSLSEGDDNATDVSIQKDGKILVVGCCNDGSNTDFAVVRYSSNGTLDPTFGKDGIVLTSLSQGDDQAVAMAVQPDGKVLLTGYSNTNIATVRYKPDGSLDKSFGKNGIVITSVNSGEDEAEDIKLQDDGKIVIAGKSNNGLNNDFALLRYNPDGSPDPTFGKGGIVITGIRDGDDQASALCIQSDGKIIAAGSSNNGLNYDFALIRYNRNGSVDRSFGKNGIVLTYIREGNDLASAVIVQEDGKILAGGNSNSGTTNDFALIRYDKNGKIDTDFGAGNK
ncbi:MAG: delta-60 repeat domain-containing protein [Bacteroidota bacterium]